MAKTYDTDSKLDSQALSSWHHPEPAARHEQEQGGFPRKGLCPSSLLNYINL